MHNLKLYFTLPLLALAVATAGVLWAQFSATGGANASPSEHPLESIDASFFADYEALKLESWTGPTEGFLDEAVIREAAATWGYGPVGEIALVRLSQLEPGRYGAVGLASQPEALNGPVWAVVFSGRPYLAAASPKATVFVNVLYFSATSGETLFGTQAAIVEP